MESNLKKWNIKGAFSQNIHDYNIQGPCSFSLSEKECASTKEAVGDCEAWQSLAYRFHDSSVNSRK